MNVLLLRDVAAILLAGGAGERLYPLTRERAKPAVPFGGPYRIVDFALSNCINSGLRRIFIATQYKAQSLNRHVRMGWNVVNRELGEFVEILPPQKRMGEHWYLGTADAVWQNLHAIERERPRWVIVLSGDHIYKMDYGKMLDVHIARGARLTVAALEVPLAEARRYGVLDVDAEGRVGGFREKPDAAEPAPWNPAVCLASMGIYIFDTDVLVRELQKDAESDSTHDFAPRRHPASRAARPRGSSRTSSGTRTRRRPSTGATSARSTPTTTPRWTSSRSTRSSTSTTPTGRCGPTSRSCRRRSSSSPRTAAAGSRSSRSSPWAASCPAPRYAARSCAPTCAYTPSATSWTRSCCPTPSCTGTAGSGGRSSTAGCEIPSGAIVGYDPAEDRRRHTVSENGVVVVTPGEECLVDPAFR